MLRINNHLFKSQHQNYLPHYATKPQNQTIMSLSNLLKQNNR